MIDQIKEAIAWIIANKELFVIVGGAVATLVQTVRSMGFKRALIGVCQAIEDGDKKSTFEPVTYTKDNGVISTVQPDAVRAASQATKGKIAKVVTGIAGMFLSSLIKRHIDPK